MTCAPPHIPLAQPAMDKATPSSSDPLLQGDAMPVEAAEPVLPPPPVPDVPAPLSPAAVTTPARPPGGLIKRVATHTENLAKEVVDWVELKMQLVRLEIEETFETRVETMVMRTLDEVQRNPRIAFLANIMVNGIVFALLALGGLFFALTALAFLLGDWLGHVSWGFLIVAVITLAIGFGVWRVKPKFIRPPEERIPVDPEQAVDAALQAEATEEATTTP